MSCERREDDRRGGFRKDGNMAIISLLSGGRALMEKMVNIAIDPVVERMIFPRR